jgi:dolichol-phosphate mannosyltransferase
MKISVIIPVYNSEGIQRELYKRLTRELESYRDNFEIIFVNDGSKDNSSQVLRELCQIDKKVKFIDFSRNFGHQAAVSAGLDRAKGDVIVIMDDDLQDPPEVLPDFICKLNQGYEVVYGIRKKRKENIFKRTAFYFFYRLFRFLSHSEIPYDSGDFCVLSRKAVDEIKQFRESNRYLRGIRSWIGFRQIGISYERNFRQSGKSQYTLRKYFRFALDAIFSFSYLPLRISTLVGFMVAGLSFIYGCLIIIKKISGRIESVPGFAALFVAITFIGGVILICLGIIGEYIARLYDEAKKRPQYIIKEEKGFD